MELIILLVIVFFIGKMFGSRKRNNNDWPDEPVQYVEPRKKRGCLGTLFKWVLILFAVLVVMTLISSTSDTTTTSTPVVTSTAAPAEEQKTSAPAPTDAPTVAPTEEATPAPTAEPSTLQEWAEHVAQAEYGAFDYQFTNLISVECEQVDGENAPMIIINVKYPDSFMRDNDSRMSGFLFSAMNVNWKLADLAKEGKIEYGSVFIHGRTTFLDNYGNEIEGDAAQIRVKASEAAKVNWGFSTFTGDMLPGVAVSFGIHPVIRDGLSVEYHNKIRK